MKNEKVTYFLRGQDIENLSREELLLALKTVFQDLERERKNHSTDLDMMEIFDRGIYDK